MILKEPSQILPLLPTGMKVPAIVVRATEKHRIIYRETVLGDRTILVLDREARTVAPGPGVTLVRGDVTLIGQRDKLCGLVPFGTTFLIREPSRRMLNLTASDWSVAIVLWNKQLFEIERKRERDAFAGLESQVARLRASLKREETTSGYESALRDVEEMTGLATVA